ncbi:MAG: hypothetical protein EPO65_06885 [Dehalococcoidia bacterium]|nr:MAG: hypothetical protein EPO65_06885 [Dehalococcoidia bacterium]
MRQEMVLTDLSDLAQVMDRFPVDDRVPESMALVPVINGPSDPDAIETLAATAHDVLDAFRALLEADRLRRDGAQEDLALFRQYRDGAARAASVATRMRDAAQQASHLAGAALDGTARAEADVIAARMGRLATEAEAHAAVLQRKAAALAERDDIKQLLAEERDQEWKMEMQETLALAEGHLNARRYEEARRLLDSLVGISSVPDLNRTFRTLQNRLELVKVEAAQSALREARRCHRHQPVAALDLLEPLDLQGLPDELVRHLCGLWLEACRRIGLLGAVYYRAGFGSGAVLMPALDGTWEVVSSIGPRRWERGRRFAPQALRGARALAPIGSPVPA